MARTHMQQHTKTIRLETEKKKKVRAGWMRPNTSWGKHKQKHKQRQDQTEPNQIKSSKTRTSAWGQNNWQNIYREGEAGFTKGDQNKAQHKNKKHTDAAAAIACAQPPLLLPDVEPGGEICPAALVTVPTPAAVIVPDTGVFCGVKAFKDSVRVDPAMEGREGGRGSGLRSVFKNDQRTWFAFAFASDGTGHEECEHMFKTSAVGRSMRFCYSVQSRSFQSHEIKGYTNWQKKCVEKSEKRKEKHDKKYTRVGLEEDE